MCPGTCKSIYYYCRDDYFKFDDKNPNSLIFCEKNAVFCSKLKDIFEVSEDFCKSIGFEINENENYEDFVDGIISNSSYSPVCYNGQPSSKVFGASKRALGSKPGDKYKAYLGVPGILVLFVVLSFLY